MTNKQTIDGVSRAALELLLGDAPDNPSATWKELRALLDNPDTPYTPKGEWSFEYIGGGDIVIRNGEDWTLIKRGDGPIYEQFLYRFCEEQLKPAAQPQGEVERLRAELAERDALLREALCHAQRIEPMSVSLFNRIDATLSTSAEPKPRGEVDGDSHAPMQKAESVLIQAVAVTRKDDDEGLRLEWLLEGGIAEMEFPGMVLFAMPEANDLCDEDGSAEIYLSLPPSEQPPHSGDANEMVAKVVLPERMKAEPYATINRGSKTFKAGYNAAILDIAKLNGLKL